MPKILAHHNNQELITLCDTGCSKSVILNQPYLDKSKFKPISASIKFANESTCKIKYETTISVKLSNSYSIDVNVLVADQLSFPLILGKDVLLHFECDNNWPYVNINHHKITTYDPRSNFKIVRSKKPICLISGQSDQIIRIKNPMFGRTKGTDLYIYPCLNKSHKRQFSRNKAINNFYAIEMVCSNTEYIDIFLSNTSTNTVNLPKGCPIAHIQVLTPECKLNGITLVKDYETEQEEHNNFQSNRFDKYDIGTNALNFEFNNLHIAKSQEIEKLLNNHALAFSHGSDDLGRIKNYRFTIPLKNETDMCYEPPRPIPPGLRDSVDNEWEKWEKCGIIEESESPNNIPLLIVKKADKSVRIAVDARKINLQSIRDRFPMSNISDIMLKISEILSDENAVMSSFDLKRAYNALLIDEKDRSKISFSFRNQHFRAKRLLYGLMNGPSGFNRIMQKLFSNDDEIFIFLDDVCIVSKNWEAHLLAIERFLTKCIEFGLVLDVKKAQIAKDQIIFLGERITRKGREPTDKHLLAIRNYRVPRTRKELKRFLGMANYLNKFVKNASIILKPLHQLTSQKVDFEWNQIADIAFNEFKEKLALNTGIRHRNTKYPLVLTCDASLDSCASYLSQLNDNGQLEPLGFQSHVFSESERKASARHRELYAIIYGLQHFQFELLGYAFYIITDHYSLKYLCCEKSKGCLSMRLSNAYSYLSQFDFQIIHRGGTTPEMSVADALSRSVPFELLEHKNNDDLFERELFQIEHLNDHNQLSQNKISSSINLLECFSSMTEPISNNTKTLFRFAEQSFNRTDFIRLYKKDNNIQNIIQKLQLKSKTTESKFRLDDNILYNISGVKPRLVIPCSIGREFVQYLHIVHIHPGALALQKLVTKNVWLYNVQAIAKDISYKCEHCIATKPRPKLRPEIILKKSSQYFPHQRCYIDLIDYGKSDRNRKRYLLTMVCGLTDYIDAIPLANKTETLVQKALLELILKWGCFYEIVCDNGREWSSIFESIAKKLGITTIRISPYNSCANRVERSHRSIHMKTRLMNIGKDTWSNGIPYVLHSLNNTPKAKLNFLTPAEVLFGRNFYMPYELDSGEIKGSDKWVDCANTYFNDLWPALAKLQMDRYKANIKFDKKSYSFKTGSLALIYKPSMEGGKLSRMFVGPCRVIAKQGKNSYRLKDLQTQKVYRRHIRHLRPLAIDTPAHSRYQIDTEREIASKTITNKETEIVDYENDNENVVAYLGLHYFE